MWRHTGLQAATTPDKLLSKRRKLGDYGQIPSARLPPRPARHVAKDLRAALCGVGPDRTQARSDLTNYSHRMSVTDAKAELKWTFRHFAFVAHPRLV